MAKKRKHKIQRVKPALLKKSDIISLSLRTKLLFLIGISCIFLFISWKIHEATLLSFSYHPSPALNAQAQHIPTHITIPDAQINLPVLQTNIVSGIWQIADNGASHLATSANPGTQGTIIIYGHNTVTRFANIPYMYLGEKIIVQTANKQMYAYTVTQTIVVNPDQTDILTQQKGETLIVYTCYGFADLQRFVVIAKPINR